MADDAIDLSGTEKNSEPFEAQFDSKCAACGDMMHEGDLIIRTIDGDFIHKDCEGY